MTTTNMPGPKPVWETSFGREFVGKTPSWRNLGRKGFTELWATALLVFAACLGAHGVIHSALAIGFSAAVLVASFGAISGCHMNPAVSLAMLICGLSTGVLEFLVYIGSQITGGIIGGIFGRTVMSHSTYNMSRGGMTSLDVESANPAQGTLLEAIITAQLVLTILCTAHHTTTAPAFVGLSIFCGVLIGGNITGGSMNPARSFGPAVAYEIFVGGGFAYHYVYWLGPALGAVFAGILCKLVFADEGHRWPVMESIFGAKRDHYGDPDVVLKARREQTTFSEKKQELGLTPIGTRTV